MSQQKRQNSKRTRTLIIVRHAHRDKKPGPDVDNGLSKKGREQAKRIRQFYEKVFLKKTRISLISSPKRRCLETLEPLAKKKSVRIIEVPELDEGGRVQDKVKAFLRNVTQQDSSLLMGCTHGDIIPILFKEMIGAELELDKGGWAEFQIEDGKFLLQRFLQGLDF